MLQNSLTLQPMVFLNEVCSHTAAPRRECGPSRESAAAHSHRQVCLALAFLRPLLQAQESSASALSNASPPQLLLLVADERDDAWLRHQQAPPPGVRALTMHQYVASLCGDRGASVTAQHPLWELLDTLAAARSCSSAATPLAPLSRPGFSPFLSSSEARKGLQCGALVIGQLSVFTHCTQEAEVVFEKPLPVSLPHQDVAGSCIVTGMMHRNRAMHGDMVVIEVRKINVAVWWTA